MAVDLFTYAGLLDAIGKWLNRRDLVDQIPGFLALAHAKFNRELRLTEMLTTSKATSDMEWVPVPEDWLETFSMEVDDDPNLPPLEYITAAQAKKAKAAQAKGKVRWYTMANRSFKLLPLPVQNLPLTLTYYAEVPALSDVTETNWLQQKAPDLYLYSSLLEATPYLKNDERLPVWVSARQKVIDDLNAESEKQLRPRGETLKARVRPF